MVEEKKTLLEITNLKQYFNVSRKDEVKAIGDISFHTYEGETFGLIDESGSGKSTTGRSVIRLYNPAADEIFFDGKDISKIKPKAGIQAFRRDVQMIFQDPCASSSPRMEVNDIIAEGTNVNGLAEAPKEREEKVNGLLKMMGSNPSHSTRYPHEFSDEQRQRIGIARALAVNPRFITCDEPISALDVSIQAQVVNLLQDLQKEQGLTYSFIIHDLLVVKHISDRIGVMHSGKLLEMGASDDVYDSGARPYAESLLSAVPLPDPDCERTRKRIVYQPVAADGKDHELRGTLNGHYVYRTENEVAMYHEEIEEKKGKAGSQPAPFLTILIGWL